LLRDDEVEIWDFTNVDFKLLLVNKEPDWNLLSTDGKVIHGSEDSGNCFISEDYNA
jgi:hypothetical protein